MYRYGGNKPRRNWPYRLPYGGVRLVDAHYLAPFRFFVVVGYNGIQHGIAQAVEQAVNANTYSKQCEGSCYTGHDHHPQTKYS